MNIDPRKWVQIADNVRARIDSGELKLGERVLVNSEAEAWGVCRGTASLAFRLLASEGRLARFPGAGYVVSAGAPGTSDDSS